MLVKFILKITLAFAVAAIFVLPTQNLSADVVLGQVDDFSGGTSDQWVEGGASANPPVFNNGAGADGAAGHLENTADGAGNSGRMLMWNDDNRWQGDYMALWDSSESRSTCISD